MSYLWFKDIEDDIWVFTLDYSSYTLYDIDTNYIEFWSCNTTKERFNNYKRKFKFKKISESDVFLEML